MTTWPSGTKASTANLDAGSDKPRLARPDIKQNVDNVNDIIDYFNVSSATDGQMLVYNSSTQKIELGSSNDGFVKFNKNYQENIVSLTSAAVVNVDASTASVFTITLSHDAEMIINNLNTGGSLSIIVKQDNDSTGNTPVFFDSSSTKVLFPNGITKFTQTNDAIDIVHIFNTGSDFLGSVVNTFRTPS
jgi:hypothetical protein